MRKALASAALAAMLSMGIGTSAVAHATSVRAAQTQDDGKDDDGGIEDYIGLVGLVGLLGLLGLRKGGGGGGGGGGGYGGPKAGKSPRGGYSTDWSNR
jgi:hypothetical protein